MVKQSPALAGLTVPTDASRNRNDSQLLNSTEADAEQETGRKDCYWDWLFE